MEYGVLTNEQINEILKWGAGRRGFDVILSIGRRMSCGLCCAT